jgi:hypothetical protein
LALPALPNNPPEAGAAVEAGFAPNSAEPPELGAPPPKSPDDAGALLVAVLGFAAPPNRPPAPAPPWAPPALPPNRPDEEDFGASAGGAPAGVVDGSENMGFAGVDEEAAPKGEAAGAWLVAPPAGLLPNRPPAAPGVAEAAGVDVDVVAEAPGLFD